MNIPELYNIYLRHPSAKTDTRQIEKGDIFFALKGPNYNGNNFIEEAFAKGASFAVVDETSDTADFHIIQVNDVLETLQQLASHHRSQYNIPVIAITGSNGKTTTKELVHVVLSTRYRTYTTRGNFNNHIGIPLTLLRIKNDAEIAVVEMGANNLGEIESYCEYVKPTHGLITNFGKAHLEGFGSIEGVRRAKSELYNYLKLNGGIAFVNTDDTALIERAVGIEQIITYGSKEGDITGEVIRGTQNLQVNINGKIVLKDLQLQLVGDYNLPNVLAAVTVGNYFNVPDDAVKNSLQHYQPSNSRSQLLAQDTNMIILDAYNANPSSMQAAITNFANMPAENKMLMLGGMMELGKDSEMEHHEIIELIGKYTWQNVLLVGNQFKNISHKYMYFDTVDEAKHWLSANPVSHTTILIKGSRSIQMEKMIY